MASLPQFLALLSQLFAFITSPSNLPYTLVMAALFVAIGVIWTSEDYGSRRWK